MFARENIERNVADDDEKCVNGKRRRKAIWLINVDEALAPEVVMEDEPDVVDDDEDDVDDDEDVDDVTIDDGTEPEPDDKRIVSIEIVITKSIRNVCNLSLTSKYGIERNSVNDARISAARYMKYAKYEI